MRKMGVAETREVKAGGQNPYSDWYCHKCKKTIKWWNLWLHVYHQRWLSIK